MLTREEIYGVLAQIDRTVSEMGFSMMDLPSWVGDQIRAMAASKLANQEQSTVIALFAGIFIGNSAACLYGGMTVSPFSPNYFAALAYTIRALLPLLDAAPGTPAWADVPIGEWDEVFRQLGTQAEEWLRELRPPEEP